MNDTRQCRCCNRIVSTKHYSRDARTKDRLSYRCNFCLGLWPKGGQLIRRPQTQRFRTVTTKPHFHGDI